MSGLVWPWVLVRTHILSFSRPPNQDVWGACRVPRNLCPVGLQVIWDKFSSETHPLGSSRATRQELGAWTSPAPWEAHTRGSVIPEGTTYTALLGSLSQQLNLMISVHLMS